MCDSGLGCIQKIYPKESECVIYPNDLSNFRLDNQIHMRQPEVEYYKSII